jgi:hypothetical protein
LSAPKTPVEAEISQEIVKNAQKPAVFEPETENFDD